MYCTLRVARPALTGVLRASQQLSSPSSGLRYFAIVFWSVHGKFIWVFELLLKFIGRTVLEARMREALRAGHHPINLVIVEPQSAPL